MATIKFADEEDLIFGFNWTDWLTKENTTIATSVWTIPAALNNEGEQNTSTHTTIKVSGGVIGELYELKNVITTAVIPGFPAGMKAERSIRIYLVPTKYD